MLISPKTRGFICTTAHPVGCAKHVESQINYVKSQAPINGPKRILIIGASTGYGLASRIAASYAMGADTIGVIFERPAAGKRTASAGWYNTAAFEKQAQKDGYQAYTINGDAFSDEIKSETIALIKNTFEQVDLIIYSLASPRRKDPKSETVYNSCLKTIGEPFANKSIDPLTGVISDANIEPAVQDEIDNTIAVMGGEDWKLWMHALNQAGVLAENTMTVAYSYVGPELTYPIYREGTIGRAKEDLEKTAGMIEKDLSELNLKAFVSINKAVVTQSSAAIPVVPLYISLLFKVMKEKNLHEGCIEQIYRLYNDCLYSDNMAEHLDDKNRIRIDDLEMREEIQQAVYDLWHQVSQENLFDISDLDGYRKDFFNLFGFELDNVDYNQEVDPNVNIPSLESEEA